MIPNPALIQFALALFGTPGQAFPRGPTAATDLSVTHHAPTGLCNHSHHLNPHHVRPIPTGIRISDLTMPHFIHSPHSRHQDITTILEPGFLHPGLNHKPKNHTSSRDKAKPNHASSQVKIKPNQDLSQGQPEPKFYHGPRRASLHGTTTGTTTGTKSSFLTGAVAAGTENAQANDADVQVEVDNKEDNAQRGHGKRSLPRELWPTWPRQQRTSRGLHNRTRTASHPAAGHKHSHGHNLHTVGQHHHHYHHHHHNNNKTTHGTATHPRIPTETLTDPRPAVVRFTDVLLKHFAAPPTAEDPLDIDERLERADRKFASPHHSLRTSTTSAAGLHGDADAEAMTRVKGGKRRSGAHRRPESQGESQGEGQEEMKSNRKILPRGKGTRKKLGKAVKVAKMAGLFL